MRVGGKDAGRCHVVSGPAVIAEQLPESHPSKKVSRWSLWPSLKRPMAQAAATSSAGHGYDAALVLEKSSLAALKKAGPARPEFRAALRDAMETMQVRTVPFHGVLR